MSEHHDEPNPSGFDPAGGPSGARSRPSAGATRFWERYGEARRHGARNGGETGAGERQEAAAEEKAGEHVCLEWCPICRGAEVVRATASPELRGQLDAIQRDALSMLRAVIDAYLARQAGGPAAPERGGERSVEEIPIE